MKLVPVKTGNGEKRFLQLMQEEDMFMQYNELDKDSIPQSPGIDRKRVISSEDIFQNGKEVIIQHGTESYRLLITKNGKLILKGLLPIEWVKMSQI